MPNWIALVGGATLGTSAVVLAVAWLARQAIAAWFRRNVTAHAERLKHDLQREMLKAQLATSSVHQVYPRLYARVARALGAASDPLGVQTSPSYEDHDPEEFEADLKEHGLPGPRRRELLAIFAQDKRRAGERFSHVRWEATLAKAANEANRASNYAVLKVLFLSPAVKAHAFAAILDLRKATIVYMRPEARDFPRAMEHIESARAHVAKLEEAMHAELHPPARPPPS